MASIVTGTARPDDLSTLILKGSTMSSERDGGSCSGGDEDDLDVDGVHSPTDASEDSVEVKVTAISPRNKNKRKCAEPRKVANDFPSGPLKKRIRHDAVTSETNGDISKSPFRPWSLPARPNPTQNTPSPPPPQTYHPVYGYHPVESVKQQEEPLSLVKSIKTEQGAEIDQRDTSNEVPPDQQILDRLAGTVTRLNIPNGRLHSEEFRKAERCPVDVRRLKQEKLLENDYDSRRIQPNLLAINMEGHSLTDPVMKQALSRIQTDDYSTRVPPHPAIQQQSPDHVLRYKVDPISPTSQSSMARSSSSMSIAGDHKKKQSVAQQQKEQRNYKNMTRERRIEANARERTRVHTISAAFDTLRRAIPAYSHNQKLSKLSVLRIACSYILTLSRVAGSDYSQDQSEPSISSCVDLVTRTIQTEGKLRKKKDE